MCSQLKFSESEKQLLRGREKLSHLRAQTTTDGRCLFISPSMTPNFAVSTTNSRHRSKPYHLPYRLTLLSIVVLTNAFLIFTVVLIIKHSNQIHQTYKGVLIINLLLPAIITNCIALFQPWFIFPHYIGFTVNPFFPSPTATKILLGVISSIIAPFCITIIYTVWFNYIIICRPHRSQILEKFYSRQIVYILTPSLMIINGILASLVLEKNQADLNVRIQKADSRLPGLFEEFGGYAVNFENLGWEEFGAISELVAILIVFFTILPVLEMLVFWNVCFANYDVISPSTHFLKLRIVLLLQFYFVIYFIFIGVPLAAHALIMILDIKSLSTIPAPLITLPMFCLPCLAFSFSYLLVLRPYRTATVVLIKRIFCCIKSTSNDVAPMERSNVPHI